jgi:hypothetical protein
VFSLQVLIPFTLHSLAMPFFSPSNKLENLGSSHVPYIIKRTVAHGHSSISRTSLNQHNMNGTNHDIGTQSANDYFAPCST